MKPTLSDYGLTDQDASRLLPILERTESSGPARWTVILPCWGLVALILVAVGFYWPVAVGIGFVAGSLIAKSIERPLFDRLVPGMKAFREYRDALAAYLHQLELERIEFWRGLSGSAFEYEVAGLLRGFGHRVDLRGGPSDAGVDIVVDGNIIVQCKAHKTPKGPAIVRELLGAKTHFKARRAILISLGGFTRESREFASTAGIELWDVHTLVELQRRRMGDENKPSDSGLPSTGGLS